MQISRLFASLLLTCLLATTEPAAAMELCSGPERVTCVVDGDTVWIKGEKIRLENIDAPEPQSHGPQYQNYWGLGFQGHEDKGTC